MEELDGLQLELELLLSSVLVRQITVNNQLSIISQLEKGKYVPKPVSTTVIFIVCLLHVIFCTGFLILTLSWFHFMCCYCLFLTSLCKDGWDCRHSLDVCIIVFVGFCNKCQVNVYFRFLKHFIKARFVFIGYLWCCCHHRSQNSSGPSPRPHHACSGNQIYMLMNIKH